MRPWKVIGLTLSLALACSGCTWSTFGFSPDNAHADSVNSGLNASNAGTMVLKGTAKSGNMVVSSPAVVTTGTNGHPTGTVYVGSEDGKLYTFDEFGSANCSATPKSCAPLWTATTGSEITSSPAVANGVVYVGSWDGKLNAFDAAGTVNCSGSPRVCAPLWTASTPQQVIGPPTVANGDVYVISNDGKLYAFDASGDSHCSGVPKTCLPLWTSDRNLADIESQTAAAPAVVSDIVYVPSDAGLVAYDASGTRSCSGTPVVCAPLWTGVFAGDTIANGGHVADASVAVSNGVAYINTYNLAVPAAGASVPCTERRPAVGLRRVRDHQLFRKSEDVPAPLDRIDREPS